MLYSLLYDFSWLVLIIFLKLQHGVKFVSQIWEHGPNILKDVASRSEIGKSWLKVWSRGSDKYRRPIQQLRVSPPSTTTLAIPLPSIPLLLSCCLGCRILVLSSSILKDDVRVGSDPDGPSIVIGEGNTILASETGISLHLQWKEILENWSFQTRQCSEE